MDCDRCGKRLKSKEFVNVQRHYESDLCKRNFTAAVNQHQMQESEPPADKRQPRIQEFAMGGAVYQRGGNVCEAV